MYLAGVAKEGLIEIVNRTSHKNTQGNNVLGIVNSKCKCPEAGLLCYRYSQEASIAGAEGTGKRVARQKVNTTRLYSTLQATRGLLYFVCDGNFYRVVSNRSDMVQISANALYEKYGQNWEHQSPNALRRTQQCFPGLKSLFVQGHSLMLRRNICTSNTRTKAIGCQISAQSLLTSALTQAPLTPLFTLKSTADRALCINHPQHPKSLPLCGLLRQFLS